MPQRSLGQAPGTWVASSLHVCIPSIWLGVTPSASLTKKKRANLWWPQWKPHMFVRFPGVLPFCAVDIWLAEVQWLKPLFFHHTFHIGLLTVHENSFVWYLPSSPDVSLVIICHYPSPARTARTLSVLLNFSPNRGISYCPCLQGSQREGYGKLRWWSTLWLFNIAMKNNHVESVNPGQSF